MRSLKSLLCTHFYDIQEGRRMFFINPRRSVLDTSGIHDPDMEYWRSHKCLGCGYRFFETTHRFDGMILEPDDSYYIGKPLK